MTNILVYFIVFVKFNKERSKYSKINYQIKENVKNFDRFIYKKNKFIFVRDNKNHAKIIGGNHHQI